MTCKDCIHNGVCWKQEELLSTHEWDEEQECCEDASRFIELPCKVGDKIYAHWNCGKHGKSVAEFEVTHMDIDYLPDIEVAYRSQTSLSGTYHFAKLSDFGKTVFLTREEAEKTLKERERGCKDA